MKSISSHHAPISEVTPKGWLRRQLEIQASGLGGKLHTFWPDIKESAWIGGDREGWERVPYWLDGFIPLAYLLRDEALRRTAKRYIDEIVARQADDGWLCPVPDTERRDYDMWAYFLILKVLVLWHDTTGDERIEGVVDRALRCLDRHIDVHTLSAWGSTRWFEALIAIFWLYDRTGDGWLIDLAVKLRAQGFDWVAFFKDWPLERPNEYGRWSQMNHVVNQAMMIKSGPLYGRLSGLESDRCAASDMIRQISEHHGTATGIFTGDECLAGTNPNQGTELCAVVEMMYSLEWLTLLTREAAWGDMLEELAFNALPATFSPDMNYHQYDQQVNQVACVAHDPPVFLTNGPEANLFGVEPNYGCCTANMHQGWPKFAGSLFTTSERGFAVAAYAPARLDTTWHNVPVAIEIDTHYPFGDTIRIAVTTEHAVDFELSLRVPAWADPNLEIDGASVSCRPGEYASLRRTWSGEAELTLTLGCSPRLCARPDQLAVIKRGPLLFSIPLGEEWTRQSKEGSEESPWLNNYEIRPTTPWNFALCVDEGSVGELSIDSATPGETPFSPGGAPLSIEVPVKSVAWSMERGSAKPLPEGDPVGDIVSVRMIPYGCTNLRMTEMPLARPPNAG